MKFDGIFISAITPSASDGQIDREAFAAVLELLIEAKVHGIIVGGSTGEYYAQSASGALRDLASLRQESDRHSGCR